MATPKRLTAWTRANCRFAQTVGAPAEEALADLEQALGEAEAVLDEDLDLPVEPVDFNLPGCDRRDLSPSDEEEVAAAVLRAENGLDASPPGGEAGLAVRNQLFFGDEQVAAGSLDPAIQSWADAGEEELVRTAQASPPGEFDREEGGWPDLPPLEPEEEKKAWPRVDKSTAAFFGGEVLSSMKLMATRVMQVVLELRRKKEEYSSVRKAEGDDSPSLPPMTDALNVLQSDLMKMVDRALNETGRMSRELEVADLDEQTRARVRKWLDAVVVKASVIQSKGLIDKNTKMSKGEGFGVATTGLSLRPGTFKRVAMCPFSTKACRGGCLYDSGQAEKFRGKPFGSSARSARERRTLMLIKDPISFHRMLDRVIQNRGNAADEAGMKEFGVRLNVLSDLPWEEDLTGGATVMERHPSVAFYDYTKNPSRMRRYLDQARGQDNGWPGNYDLTFSMSELNLPFALWVLENGGNVAVPFDIPSGDVNYRPLPRSFMGFPVVDGDLSDARFLDHKYFSGGVMDDPAAAGKVDAEPESIERVRASLADKKGMIVGLRLKGTKYQRSVASRKKRERRQGKPFGEVSGGFVLYADDMGTDPGDFSYDAASNRSEIDLDFVLEMVGQSVARRNAQLSRRAEIPAPELEAMSALGGILGKRFEDQSKIDSFLGGLEVSRRGGTLNPWGRVLAWTRANCRFSGVIR
jgi:hypothetical protein